MPDQHSKPKIRYAAVVQNVREVSLLGHADLDLWRQHLADEHLAPRAVQGRAEVLLTATSLVWMGIPFREFTCSVSVAPPEDPASLLGYFLVHACNSSGLLAWCERTFFATPYVRARIQLALNPASFSLADSGPSILSAQASDTTASLSNTHSSDLTDDFFGPIFLPTRPAAPERCFVADLSGPLSDFPFDTQKHQFKLSSPAGHPLTLLVETGFQPIQWRVRAAARHGKSPTWPRSHWPLPSARPT